MSDTSIGSARMAIHGTPGEGANILMSTLKAVQNQQAINNRPLKVPDLRQFGVGRRVNLTA